MSDDLTRRVQAHATVHALEEASRMRPLEASASFSDTLLRGAICSLENAEAAMSETIRWAWDGWITESSSVEIFGKSTAGKTTFATLLIAAMCAPPDKPVELFGRRVTPMAKGRKAFVAFGENSRPSAALALDLAMRALGIDRRYAWGRIILHARSGLRAGHFTSENEVITPSDGNTWAHVMHAATVQRSLGLLVFDSRARIFGDFGSSIDEVAQATVSNIITQITNANAVVIVLSHPSKAGKLDLESISGSYQRGAGTDGAIAISAVKKKDTSQTVGSVVRLIKSRDTPERWPMDARVVLRRQGDGSAFFDVEQVKAKDPSSSSKDERAEKERVVLQAIAETKNVPISINAIFERTNMNKKLIEKIVDRLVEHELVRICPGAMKGGSNGYLRTRKKVQDPEPSDDEE